MTTSIGSILSNAASGLAASEAGIAVISGNIANAGVAGFTAKRLNLATIVTGDQSSGVRTGLVTRSVDAAVEAGVWSSASSVGALTVRSQVLNAVNATQGTPGDGTSLADAETALETSFTLLQSQPSAQTQQAAVVTAAGTLASTINATASSISTERNSVQSNIASSVDALNSALTTVQDTTRSLMSAISAGTSTADLEDTRDAALQTLSGMLNVHYDEQVNGNITVLGQNGLSIPLDSRFSTSSVALSPSTGTAGSASAPPIMMQSANASLPAQDVTGQLTGGTLGELLQLRDTTLPAYTASLDSFSSQLANKFSAQGLQLFTDGTTTTPLTSYAGLSSQIQVNAAVISTPSLVRDGTSANMNTAGAAGFSGVIDNVVNTTFSASGATPSLASTAQSFVSQQSIATGQATSDLAAATSYQTTLATKFSDGSSVNVDGELGLMIQLQNSYQANARIVQTAQSMFATLLNATTTTGA